MVSIFFNKVRPIGLDIGSNSVKLIQLAFAGDRIKVAAGEEVHIPRTGNDAASRDQLIIDAIKHVISKGHFKGREVVSCLSNEQVQIRNFRIDASDHKEIENNIFKEADAKFGINRDKYDINYMISGNIRQGSELKHEIILFSAARQIINNHIDLIEKAGLIPIAIDNVPCALFRCFLRSLRRQEDNEQVSIFVDIGSTFTTLIIAKGNELCFVKQIPVGGDMLNAKVASKLDITAEEAGLMRNRLMGQENNAGLDDSTRLVMNDAMSSVIEQLTREISLCFKYFTVTFRGNKPDKAYCTGGEAYERLIMESLNNHLSLEVEQAKPLRGMDIGAVALLEDKRDSYCEWAVPVGLSLKGINLNTYGNETDERN
jgi:type IV pilus assembly protein PilM